MRKRYLQCELVERGAHSLGAFASFRVHTFSRSHVFSSHFAVLISHHAGERIDPPYGSQMIAMRRRCEAESLGSSKLRRGVTAISAFSLLPSHLSPLKPSTPAPAVAEGSLIARENLPMKNPSHCRVSGSGEGWECEVWFSRWSHDRFWGCLVEEQALVSPARPPGVPCERATHGIGRITISVC